MLRRIVLILLGVVLVLLLVAAVFGIYTARRSFPGTAGEIHLPGLEASVDIYRDQYGIPQIYAGSAHDLFYAQGYVHAQDRFWQMDFWRHIGSGRLAEMFGKDRVDTDKYLRTMGWARVAQAELDTADAETLAILQAYADGVNAYLADHQGSALSLEYAILKLINPQYQPEPWQPLHTLTWAKVMAYDLGGNMDNEIYRATLSRLLTPQQMADIIPDYPPDTPLIIPSSAAVQAEKLAFSTAVDNPRLASALQVVSHKSRDLADLLGPTGSGVGSNNWVISGELTATGMPLLANDPHLGIQMPSIWYQIGLYCQPKSAACPYDVAGFSFAGAPGVIIGHNDRIAWGFTNVNPDVQDLYIEKINPGNPDQYEVNGQWVDMQLVSEMIQVAGGEPQPVTIRYTRHGPVLSDVEESMQGWQDTSSLDLPESYAVALHWTALDPGTTFMAIWKLDSAQDWDEFRDAASLLDVPSQNLVYADVQGNIGYQTPGRIPIRASGDGSLPVPGWTDDYEWVDYIPFEELPHTFNPPQGYIVTANNPVVGADYPYLIGKEFDYGFRASRIVDLIANAPGKIDIPYIQQIQGDDKDLNAEVLVPVLMQVPLEDAHLQEIRNLLGNWDFQAQMDSAPAAIYEAFWKNLLAETFHDELPEDYWPEGGSRWFVVVQNLVQQPDSPWWDDRSTSQVEDRDAIFVRAFSKAVAELESTLGKNAGRWAWGDLHTATFRNASLGESGIAPIEAIFNRGPFLTSGSESIVNATGWNAVESYAVDWLPSMRMIVDLGDLRNSLTVHTTGQSGHAYHPNYIDMADLWRQIQYYPMLWERSQVEAAAASHLLLAP